MSDLLPEDQAVSRLTDFLFSELNFTSSASLGLPEGWRVADDEDLDDAGWSDDETEHMATVLVGPDGRLFEVEVDVTLAVLRRAGAV